ncbi:YdcF family protein [Ectobacillus funiculus]|uniref:YdcF family protein n=1 Tax=Ectobacillus funiculus TaxID=137993 RepID=UPI003979461C
MLKNKFIFIIFIGIIFISIILRDAGNSLVIDEHPNKSDVIVVLSGGKGRLEKGVDLYKKGFAPYLMISNGAEDNLYEGARKLGMPTEAIIIENQAGSTRENAIFTEKLMIEHQFQSAIIVSSNYHMRRVNINYEQIFKDSKLKLIYCSVNDNSIYNPKKWWLSKKDFRTTYIEYIKIAGNYFGVQGEMAKKVLRFFS